jgi:hypothetical protein
MRIHITAVSSAMGEYCENEAWIRAKFRIRKPTTDAMLLGTITHGLLEYLDNGIVIKKGSSLREIHESLRQLLMRHYIDYKNRHLDDNYDPIESRILDYIDCLAYRFTSRYYKLQALNKEYVSSWVNEEHLTHTLKVGDSTVTLSGRLDRYKEIGNNECVVSDYKTSANPKLDDSMKIQLDGYAYLLKMNHELDCLLGIIEFPLYQITEYYRPDPDNFVDVSLPAYVDMMKSSKMPPYFPGKKACNWCEDAVRKKCLELRPK